MSFGLLLALLPVVAASIPRVQDHLRASQEANRFFQRIVPCEGAFEGENNNQWGIDNVNDFHDFVKANCPDEIALLVEDAAAQLVKGCHQTGKDRHFTVRYGSRGSFHLSCKDCKPVQTGELSDEDFKDRRKTWVNIMAGTVSKEDVDRTLEAAARGDELRKDCARAIEVAGEHQKRGVAAIDEMADAVETVANVDEDTSEQCRRVAERCLKVLQASLRYTPPPSSSSSSSSSALPPARPSELGSPPQWIMHLPLHDTLKAMVEAAQVQLNDRVRVVMADTINWGTRRPPTPTDDPFWPLHVFVGEEIPRDEEASEAVEAMHTALKTVFRAQVARARAIRKRCTWPEDESNQDPSFDDMLSIVQAEVPEKRAL